MSRYGPLLRCPQRLHVTDTRLLMVTILQCEWSGNIAGLLMQQLVESEHILVLILDHIWSTVDRIGVSPFSQISTGPAVPVISVGSISPLTTAIVINMGGCYWC